MLLSLKSVIQTQTPAQSYDITDYISDSMYVWADGIYNQGINKAHSNSATSWVDLSGNKDGYYSGNASRRKWEDNCAVFSGEDDGYEFLSPSTGTWTPTMEAVFSMNSIPTGIQSIFNNQEGGGANLYYISNCHAGCNCYAGTTYAALEDTTTTLEPNKCYHVALSCDGKVLKFYLNGSMVASTAVSGLPKINYISPLTVGRDSRRNSSSGVQQLMDGKVYAARAYSRVLSDEEILHNYKVDSYRFGIA